jgi:hypothetical protein
MIGALAGVRAVRLGPTVVDRITVSPDRMKAVDALTVLN